MLKEPPSPLAFTLICLRSAAGVKQSVLSHTLGLPKESISQYERGKKLTREKLDSLLEPLGYPPEAIDVCLFAHGLLYPESHDQAPSPVALSPEEQARIDRAAMAAGRTAAEAVRRELMIRRKFEQAEAARKDSEGLLQSLMTVSPTERSGLVATFPDFWSWALAVRVCEASIRRAAHSAEESLELAELALSIAERAPGEKSWRSRLKGYCWAHVANSRRVSNNLAGAEEAFTQAWNLWRGGAKTDPELLPEWRLYSLEASLRGPQRRFSEALELLDRARAACGDDPLAVGKILLKREHLFEQKGDLQQALATLAEAIPFIEASGDSRQLFVVRFNMVDDLCHLERYEEAEELLPQVFDLALEHSNELDLIRLAWLRSRVAAGLGRTEEAIASLGQVGRDFTHRELPYDAALSYLDLSVLLLKAGRSAEMQDLAAAMAWVFAAKGIHREAVASLKVFCDAARQEAATVELARHVIAEIERVRHIQF